MLTHDRTHALPQSLRKLANRLRNVLILALALVSVSAPARADSAPARADSAPARADSTPIRAQRRWAVAGEVGWNSLPGLGADLSFHASPYFALDTGLGLGLAGFKAGLRARANLLPFAWTPLVGLGLTYETGAPAARNYQSRGDSAMVRIMGSPYAQLVAGVNYTDADGFMFMATGGYAALLRDNTKYVSGSRATYDDVRRLVAGGLVVSVAFGYAF